MADRPTLPCQFTLQTSAGLFSSIDFGGRGQECLLIHGTGQNALSWTRFARAVLAHYRVFAFDMRGHGQTRENSTDPEQYWRDLGPVTAALGLVHPILIGHSTGAYAATAYVASGNAAAAIVCVDGFTLDPPVAAADFASGMQRQQMRERLFATFRYGWNASASERDDYIESVVAGAADDPFNVGIEPSLLREMLRRCFVENEDWFLRRPTLEEIATVTQRTPEAEVVPDRSVYDKIDVPLLFVWADRGLSLDRRDELERIVRAKSNRALVTIRASHNVPMQQPLGLAESVVTALRELLGRV